VLPQQADNAIVPSNTFGAFHLSFENGHSFGVIHNGVIIMQLYVLPWMHQKQKIHRSGGFTPHPGWWME
jgi:hypothetical protein